MAKRVRSNDAVVSGRPRKQVKAHAAVPTPSRSLNHAKLRTFPLSRPSYILNVFVCGDGDLGELGLGAERRNGKKPVDVKTPRPNDLLDAETVGVVQIAAGGVHAAALTRDSKVLTWGVNDDGALGRITKKKIVESTGEDNEEGWDLNPYEAVPTAVAGRYFGHDADSLVQVVATDSATFVLTAYGHVYGWGIFNDANGKFGFSADDVEKGTPQWFPKLTPQLENIIALAAGSNHVLALNKSGLVFGWGCNQQRQLGNRLYPLKSAQIGKFHSLLPAAVFLPGKKIVSIACGSDHSFAVDNHGRVYSWGLNNMGQTGILEGAGSTMALVELPTWVRSLASHQIENIQGGSHHSIACSKEGAVLVWGRCDYCQMGIPLDTLPSDVILKNERGVPRILVKPAQIPNLQGLSVGAGIDNSIAITREGKAYSWGYSSNYRTGLGTEDTVFAPTLIDNSVISSTNLTKAACGGQFLLLADPSKLSNGV